MTNTEKLNEAIKNSGYKITHVASELNITYMALQNKIRNVTEFKASEIMKLKKLLKLTNGEANSIFFDDRVDKTSTK